MRGRSTRRGIVGLALLALLGTACSLRTTGTPSDPMVLTAHFDEVRNLLVGHAVMVNDVSVGRVTGIELGPDFDVAVELSVRRDLAVPVGTTARVRRTSLLGEDFVELDVPADVPDGAELLATGAQIRDTRVLPDLEDVALQAEQLIASFAVNDLQTLLDTAVEAYVGRGPQLRGLITRFADVSETYAAESERVGRIIEDFAQLGGDLRGGTDPIGQLFEEVSRASVTFAGQRDRVVRTLEDVIRLSDATQQTLLDDQALADIEATLRDLTKVAHTLNVNSGDLADVVQSLTVLSQRLPRVIEDDSLVLFGWIMPESPLGTGAGEPLDADGLGRLLEPLA